MSVLANVSVPLTSEHCWFDSHIQEYAVDTLYVSHVCKTAGEPVLTTFHL